MTPEQQAALEGLVSRPLTEGEIALIEPLLEVRNDVEIAKVISTGRTKSSIVIIGSGTVLNTMQNGGAFLDLLNQYGTVDRDVYWAMDLVKQGRMELGRAKVKNQLLAMAAAKPEFADDVAALLSLCEVPDPIHFNEVSDALNMAEGIN